METPFSWKAHERPIVAVAPMLGITTLAWRQKIRQVAPEAVLFTEMMRARDIILGTREELSRLLDPQQKRPLIAQITENNARESGEAARMLEDVGVSGIDINIGCPEVPFTSDGCGAALARQPGRAAELVSAVRKAVSVPVSVKMRLDEDGDESSERLCRTLEAAGSDALIVHGRTIGQGFKGAVNWDAIYRLKRMVSIPVIGNGDIVTVDGAKQRIGNLDGIMIGRGVVQHPQLIVDVINAFSKRCAQTHDLH